MTRWEPGTRLATLPAVRLRLALVSLLFGCVAAPRGELADRCEMPELELPADVDVEALSSISCGSHTDTGYRNGSSFTITVVTVDGHPVERQTANAYYVMAQAAERAGVQIRIVSGFRTMAEQQHLYYCYTSCSCNSCNLAARPGYSNHQSGHALDLNTSSGGVYNWLAAHGGAYGFSRTVPSEAWHWEWWGGGPGGGPCGTAPPPPPDADGDGVRADRDCDDHDPHRFPGNHETCDGVDNDCDGHVDDGLVRSCGTDVGECVAGTQTCRAGDWGRCEDSVDPVPESCDRLDDDCDGTVDEDRVCEREEALLAPGTESPTLESDVDGDGRADACAIVRGAFTCLMGGPHGMERVMTGPPMPTMDATDAARIRMADVDGDGRADVCAPDGDHLACFGAGAAALDRAIPGPAISTTLTNLELADVDGDARLDVCTRDASGLTCQLASGHGFDRLVRLDALSDANGFADPIHHGTMRFGDLDGDGRADVCVRGAGGVDCWRSLGDHFDALIRGPRWSDAAGWDALAHWSTIRLVDVDGDARVDLCGRDADRFVCVRSSGTSFGETIVGPAMRDADGWNRPEVYTTIRMADVSGDGHADVCAREPSGVRCWIYDGRAFDRAIVGPALDDASGWTVATRYRSIRLADIDGDGRADLCARGADGLRCFTGSAGGFDREWIAPAFSDAAGLGTAVAWASLRLAGGGMTHTATPTAIAGGCSVGGAPSRCVVAAIGIALLVLRRRVLHRPRSRRDR
jgi:hypothetical protein